MTHPAPTQPFRHRLFPRLLFGVALVVLQGCHGPQTKLITAPAKHSVRSDRLLVLSDFKLEKDHALIEDLIRLRKQVTANLNLPVLRKDVVVYLFSNQMEYAQYLNATYPGLPNRRAYFVGNPRELAIYMYWSDGIREDLRHEATHGILHASLSNVPLWLDEGLAEYYEVPGDTPGGINGEYVSSLRTMLAGGWRPDLERLEQLGDFAEMTQVHYQESWAWVHFLTHHSDETRRLLVEHLHALQSETPSLHVSLSKLMPNYVERFREYVTHARG